MLLSMLIGRAYRCASIVLEGFNCCCPLLHGHPARDRAVGEAHMGQAACKCGNRLFVLCEYQGLVAGVFRMHVLQLLDQDLQSREQADNTAVTIEHMARSE